MNHKTVTTMAVIHQLEAISFFPPQVKLVAACYIHVCCSKDVFCALSLCQHYPCNCCTSLLTIITVTTAQIWENWTPEDDAVEAEDDDDTAGAAAASTGGETLSVTVTEVQDGTEFFLQSATEPRVNWLADQLSQLGLSDGPAATGLVQGSLCLGQFSLDNNW